MARAGNEVNDPVVAKPDDAADVAPEPVVALPAVPEDGASPAPLPDGFLADFEATVTRISSELRRAIGKLSETAQLLALGPDRTMAIPAFDQIFRFSLPFAATDITQSRILTQAKLPNDNVFQALALRLPPDGVVYDIGGGLGVSAAVFAKVLKARRIHVFEPQRIMLDTLKTNLALNGITTAVIHEVAIMDAVTRVDPGAFRPQNMGATPFLKHASGRYTGTSIDVLDLDPPDIVYMDFAGPKLLAVMGATKTLAAHMPFVVMDKTGRDVVEVNRLLTDLGYEMQSMLEVVIYYPKISKKAS